MKNLLYKSKFIFTLFIGVSIMLTLLGSALFINKDSARDLDFLSDDYYKMEIYSDEMLVEDLVSFVKNEEDYLILKEYSAKHGYSVAYSNEGLFNISMKSGRLFDAEDFSRGDNVVIINEAYRKELDIRGDKLVMDDEYYDIVGTFETRGGINGDTRWFVPMYTNEFKKDYAYGIFLFDSTQGCTKNIVARVAKMAEERSGSIPQYAPGMSEEGKQISSTGSNLQIMLGLFALVILLVAVNSLAACNYWLNDRREEIALRQLCGANNKDIKRFIVGEFFEIILSAFFIGTIVSTIFLKIALLTPVRNSMLLMIGSSISIEGIIIGLLLETAVGLICIRYALKKNGANQIVEVLRR